MTASGPIPPPFFSAPLEPAEIERLQALVERRIALRGAVASDPVPRVVASCEFQTSALDDPALAGFRALTGPLFDARRGPLVARTAKRLANVVLWSFGRPQRYVNTAAFHTIESTTRVLRTMERDATRMGACIARADEQLGALERRMVGIMHRHAGRPDGPRVRLGRDAATADGSLHVDGSPRPGVDVVADVRRLPFACGSLAEIAILGVGTSSPADPRALADGASSHWLALLRPGGSLRIACADGDAAARLLNAIIQAQAESGATSRLTFRTSETAGASTVEIRVHEAA